MAFKNLFKLSKKKDQVPKNQQPQGQTSTQAASNNTSDLYNEPISSDSSSPNGTFTSVKDAKYQGDSTTTSFTSAYSLTTGSNSNIFNQYNHLTNDASVPKELVPIVTLINCQNSRIYNKRQLYLNVEKNDGSLEQDLSYQLVDGLVKGNQIVLYKEGLQSSFKPISINLLEATVKTIDSECSLILSSSDKAAYHLKFNDISSLQSWLSCIKLSNYEFTKLNESYTASLLSSKATLLSDLHVLMAETRYQHEEWCNIKFSKNSNWIKCFCVITPCDRLKRQKHVKNGTIQFYTSSRTTKKNLICSINSVESCFAVYPNHVGLIDDSTLIKLNGDLTIFNLGLKFDDLETPTSPISRTNSITSSSPNGARLRSNSNATKSHLRSASFSSISSSKSIKGCNVDNTSLYILPRPHNGVKNFETLIRFLIPLYDSFQVYGRPKRLIAEKFDLQSLLFGLPSLPHTEYLTTELAFNLIKKDWPSIITSDENYNFMALYSDKIKELSIKSKAFKGFGDLKTSLHTEINFEDPLTRFNNYSIPDFDDTVSPSTPKYAFSFSDLPPNAQRDSEHLRIPSSSNLNMLANSPSQQQSIPVIKSPRMRSASNQLGSSMAYLNSSISSMSTGQNSSQGSPDPSTLEPGFKNPRDSIPVVA